MADNVADSVVSDYVSRRLKRGGKKTSEEAAVATGVDLAKNDFHSFLYKNHGANVDQYINVIEQRTQLKREQLSYIVGGLVCLYLIFGGLANFIYGFIGFAYPCYESVKAVRSEGKEDDTKWLIYWTVFAAFSLLDCFAEPIMHVFPVYFIAKALFLMYLYLPQTNGAEYLYKAYVDPAVTALDKYLDSRKGEQASAATAKEPSQPSS